jgi:hypothetical protein
VRSQPPQWRDGKEFFYQAADGKLMAVPVTTEPIFEAQAANALFTLGFRMPYAVTDDGQGFLTMTFRTPSAPPPTLIVNWTALLSR